MIVMKVKVNDKTHVVCLTQYLAYNKYTITGSYCIPFFPEHKLQEAITLDSVLSCLQLYLYPQLLRLV